MELKEINVEEFAKDFLENHRFCVWCGEVFETTDKTARFCSENCRIRYKVAWDESYEERREAFLRDYENWQRIKPIWTIHNPNYRYR